ncbi:hypothetical protein ALC60_12757 [Trachymyrmex zeteki]|uniref:Uncharacterized protein n=1 Tax=Mycetomoellerius zeteki TaxID=64791 RepID=A0A151WK00_9HYME|nr:hypothetical protein ALC60_12757 [Trachymyrmex zeteki]
MCQDCKLFMTETNELISCSTNPGLAHARALRFCKYIYPKIRAYHASASESRIIPAESLKIDARFDSRVLNSVKIISQSLRIYCNAIPPCVMPVIEPCKRKSGERSGIDAGITICKGCKRARCPQGSKERFEWESIDGLSTKDWEARCGAKVLKPHGCEKVDRKISRFTA